MQCLRCRAQNKASDEHCVRCGAPLRVRRRSDRFKKRKVVIISLLLALWAGGFAYVFRDLLFAGDAGKPAVSARQAQELKKKREDRRRELRRRLLAARKQTPPAPSTSAATARSASAPQAVAAPVSAGTSPPGRHQDIAINSGWVEITDKWHHPVSRVRAALLAGGWLALPVRACYAGWEWSWQGDDGRQGNLTNGTWIPGADVALWHIGGGAALKGLGLGRPRPGAPAAWYSLATTNTRATVDLTAAGPVSGDFLPIRLADGIDEVGIFVQKEQVVAWSFGNWFYTGYAWQGNAPPAAGISVENFYRQTFAGGREEKLAAAQPLLDKSDPVNVVTMLAAALELPPKLPADDTPYYLRTDKALDRLRQAVDDAVKAGQGRFVLDVLTDEVLVRIGDIDLLLSLVPAVTASRGFEAAIAMIEGPGHEIVAKGGVDVPAVNEQHLMLYQDWLQSLVSVKAVDEAWQVYDRARGFYPDDPYLHLLGVEVLIDNGNWQEAEAMLNARDYPPDFSDRVQLLAQKISNAKATEGSIEIHFEPYSDTIPVTATLNGSLEVDFLVDTGASMVTVPSSVARRLDPTPVPSYHGGDRIVSTAGGRVRAHEVIFDSLEIAGWTEENVHALVMDIPDHPGVGLLGLNYLGRFRMDLRNDEGVLYLTPR